MFSFYPQAITQQNSSPIIRFPPSPICFSIKFTQHTRGKEPQRHALARAPQLLRNNNKSRPIIQQCPRAKRLFLARQKTINTEAEEKFCGRERTEGRSRPRGTSRQGGTEERENQLAARKTPGSLELCGRVNNRCGGAGQKLHCTGPSDLVSRDSPPRRETDSLSLSLSPSLPRPGRAPELPDRLGVGSRAISRSRSVCPEAPALSLSLSLRHRWLCFKTAHRENSALMNGA